MLKSSVSGNKIQPVQVSPDAEPRSPRRRQDPFPDLKINSNAKKDEDDNKSENGSDYSAKAHNCPSARRKKGLRQSNVTVNNPSKSKTFAIKYQQPNDGSESAHASASRIPQPRKKSTSMKVSEPQSSDPNLPKNEATTTEQNIPLNSEEDKVAVSFDQTSQEKTKHRRRKKKSDISKIPTRKKSLSPNTLSKIPVRKNQLLSDESYASGSKDSEPSQKAVTHMKSKEKLTATQKVSTKQKKKKTKKSSIETTLKGRKSKRRNSPNKKKSAASSVSQFSSTSSINLSDLRAGPKSANLSRSSSVDSTLSSDRKTRIPEIKVPGKAILQEDTTNPNTPHETGEKHNENYSHLATSQSELQQDNQIEHKIEYIIQQNTNQLAINQNFQHQLSQDEQLLSRPQNVHHHPNNQFNMVIQQDIHKQQNPTPINQPPIRPHAPQSQQQMRPRQQINLHLQQMQDQANAFPPREPQKPPSVLESMGSSPQIIKPGGRTRSVQGNIGPPKLVQVIAPGNHQHIKLPPMAQFPRNQPQKTSAQNQQRVHSPQQQKVSLSQQQPKVYVLPQQPQQKVNQSQQPKVYALPPQLLQQQQKVTAPQQQQQQKVNVPQQQQQQKVNVPPQQQQQQKVTAPQQQQQQQQQKVTAPQQQQQQKVNAPPHQQQQQKVTAPQQQQQQQKVNVPQQQQQKVTAPQQQKVNVPPQQQQQQKVNVPQQQQQQQKVNVPPQKQQKVTAPQQQKVNVPQQQQKSSTPQQNANAQQPNVNSPQQKPQQPNSKYGNLPIVQSASNQPQRMGVTSVQAHVKPPSKPAQSKSSYQQHQPQQPSKNTPQQPSKQGAATPPAPRPPVQPSPRPSTQISSTKPAENPQSPSKPQAQQRPSSQASPSKQSSNQQAGKASSKSSTQPQQTSANAKPSSQQQASASTVNNNSGSKSADSSPSKPSNVSTNSNGSKSADSSPSKPSFAAQVSSSQGQCSVGGKQEAIVPVPSKKLSFAKSQPIPSNLLQPSSSPQKGLSSTAKIQQSLSNSARIANTSSTVLYSSESDANLANAAQGDQDAAPSKHRKLRRRRRRHSHSARTTQSLPSSVNSSDVESDTENENEGTSNSSHRRRRRRHHHSIKSSSQVISLPQRPASDKANPFSQSQPLPKLVRNQPKTKKKVDKVEHPEPLPHLPNNNSGRQSPRNLQRNNARNDDQSSMAPKAGFEKPKLVFNTIYTSPNEDDVSNQPAESNEESVIEYDDKKKVDLVPQITLEVSKEEQRIPLGGGEQQLSSSAPLLVSESLQELPSPKGGTSKSNSLRSSHDSKSSKSNSTNSLNTTKNSSMDDTNKSLDDTNKSLDDTNKSLDDTTKSSNSENNDLGATTNSLNINLSDDDNVNQKSSELLSSTQPIQGSSNSSGHNTSVNAPPSFNTSKIQQPPSPTPRISVKFTLPPNFKPRPRPKTSRSVYEDNEVYVPTNDNDEENNLSKTFQEPTDFTKACKIPLSYLLENLKDANEDNNNWEEEELNNDDDYDSSNFSEPTDFSKAYRFPIKYLTDQIKDSDIDEEEDINNNIDENINEEEEEEMDENNNSGSFSNSGSNVINFDDLALSSSIKGSLHEDEQQMISNEAKRGSNYTIVSLALKAKDILDDVKDILDKNRDEHFILAVSPFNMSVEAIYILNKKTNKMNKIWGKNDPDVVTDSEIGEFYTISRETKKFIPLNNVSNLSINVDAVAI